jgi:hypothetical protein
MQVYKKRRADETGLLLKQIHEEVMQLRAATQVYTALLERFLSKELPHRAAPGLPRPEVVSPFKEAS